MKTSIFYYLTQCYFLAFRTFGKPPPKGCFSNITYYFENNISELEAFNTIFGYRSKPVDIRAISLENGSAVKLNNSDIDGFHIAIDMDNSSSASIESTNIQNCTKGINVTTSKNKGSAMPLEIKGSEFTNVETVARAPEKMLVSVDSSKFNNIGTAFDFYIPAEDIDSLNLPADTKQELLFEAAKIIRDNKSDNKEELFRKISESGLWKWLTTTKNILSTGETAITIFEKLIKYFQ